MFGDICSWERLEAHTDSLELSPLQKSAKMFPRNAFSREVTSTHYPFAPYKSNGPFAGGCSWHCYETSAITSICRGSVTAVGGEYKAINEGG